MIISCQIQELFDILCISGSREVFNYFNFLRVGFDSLFAYYMTEIIYFFPEEFAFVGLES